MAPNPIATGSAGASGRAAATAEPDLTLAVAGPGAALPARNAVVAPLSATRYKVQFTASSELHDKLQRLSALLRSRGACRDLDAVIDWAVSESLGRLEARRFARARAPRQALDRADVAKDSRHIPAAVRRAVCERDGHRCVYVDAQGRRCSERDRLEFHHAHPFGMGGNHSPDNVRLLCRAHNRYLAEVDYGRAAIRRHQEARRRDQAEAPA
jgi:5-methylcytosine-specific restriction endonuclease McrA